MKPQLLEDIGDSQSPLDALSGLTAPKISSIPIRPVAPPLPRAHFGVWRDRKTEEATVDVPPVVEQAQDEPFYEPVKDNFVSQQPEEDRFANPAEAIVIPPLDPVFAPPVAQPRTGRIASWSAAAVAFVLLAGAGLWLYDDRQDQATLAFLSDELGSAPATVETPPPPVAAAPQQPAKAPPENLPPMVVLKPDEVAKLEPESVAPVVTPAAKPAAAPVVKRPVRTAAPTRAPKKTTIAKSEPRRTVAKAEQTLAPSPATAFSKACRAMGYQEAQCRKRACVLTKFGLACKG